MCVGRNWREQSHDSTVCPCLLAAFSRTGTYIRPLRAVCSCSTTLAEEIKHVGVCRDEQEPARDSDGSGSYFM